MLSWKLKAVGSINVNHKRNQILTLMMVKLIKILLILNLLRNYLNNLGYTAYSDNFFINFLLVCILSGSW